MPSMQRITPRLWFEGDAGEAARLCASSVADATIGAARVKGAVRRFLLRRACARAEAQLHEMPDRMLQDIGISRSEIAHVVRLGRAHLDRHGRSQAARQS